MKLNPGQSLLCGALSPLAEGRELKLAYQIFVVFPLMSPLAEGRELKF